MNSNFKKVALILIIILINTFFTSSWQIVKAVLDQTSYDLYDLIKVSIYVENNSNGFHGLYFDLEYDSNILWDDDFVKGTLVRNEVNENELLYDYTSDENSHIIVSYALKGDNIETFEDGKLIDIYFSIKNIGTPGELHFFRFKNAALIDGTGNFITATWQDSPNFTINDPTAPYFINITKPYEYEVVDQENVNTNINCSVGNYHVKLSNEDNPNFIEKIIYVTNGQILNQSVQLVYGFNRIKARLYDSNNNYLCNDIAKVYRQEEPGNTEAPAIFNMTYDSLTKKPTFIWESNDNYTPADEIAYEYTIDDGTWISSLEESYTPFYNLTEGNHVFKIKAVDNVGNWSEIYEFEFVIDTTPPSLPIITIDDASPDLPIFNWDSNDNYSLKENLYINYYLNDTQFDGIGIYSYQPDTALAYGSYTFSVEVTDEAGNKSEKVSEIYDNYEVLSGEIIELDELTVKFPQNMEPFIFELENVNRDTLQHPNSVWNSNTFKLSPYEKEFTADVILEINFDKTDIPIDIDKEKVKLFYYDYNLDKWISIESEYMQTSNILIGKINKFKY